MNKKEVDLITQAKEKVLALFHRAYKTCPAYRDFIDSSGISPQEIRSVADFEKIPITDKRNYIRKYSVAERLIDNRQLADFYMITASSGSTGEPSFWPRDLKVDEFLDKKKEALYEQHFQISKKKSLCINTFALGIWTAGMLTSRLSWGAAKNNKLTVISTGIHKENVRLAITHLGSYYDQIILLGYPPFLLETVEFLTANDLDLKALNVKIMYTSDSLSNKARQYLLERISSSVDPSAVIGFYAASDTGIIAAQSPLTVKLMNTSMPTEMVQDFFHTREFPALFAFDPQVKYLETINNEVIVSSDQPVPLIRYNIHDRGNVMAGATLKKILRKNKVSVVDSELDDWYVYIFGKTDSVLLTANVYIEDIRYCIEQSDFIDKLSGNFKYGVEELDSLRKRLVVKIFLKEGAELTRKEKVVFQSKFTKDLFFINTDLSAVKSDAFQPIKFLYEQSGDNKYEGFKIKYFL